MNIFIKYFDKDMEKITTIGGDKSNWFDVRANNLLSEHEWTKDTTGSQVLHYSKGDIIKFGLGFAMQMPENMEAYVIPRSSTFRRWGFFLTNHFGLVDTSYCGDDDQWGFEVYATRDGVIYKDDRIGQFRLQEKMGNMNFIEVEHLNNQNRGGYGTTGTN